jgi:hypothetical protein
MNYAGFLQLAAKSGNARARYFGECPIELTSSFLNVLRAIGDHLGDEPPRMPVLAINLLSWRREWPLSRLTRGPLSVR